jgi:hypothetical protein
MSKQCRKTRRGDVHKKNGPMQHTLTERFFSCNNLIKPQYTCLLVSSLTCKKCKHQKPIIKYLSSFVTRALKKKTACQKPKEAVYVITELNCHNKCQFS